MKAYENYTTFIENTNLVPKVNTQYLVKYASKPRNDTKSSWEVRWKVVECVEDNYFKDNLVSNNLKEVILEMQELNSSNNVYRFEVDFNNRVFDYTTDKFKITTKTHIM